jgi:salicylate hydroxylase
VKRQLLVAGAGLGGLAAGVACSRAGWGVRVFEQAARLTEVGAGIQLGPNATSVLAGWGLGAELAGVAAFPTLLRVRSARDGRQLATLRLGAEIERRYGAPYATVHRADLQQLLLQAAEREGVGLSLSSRVSGMVETGEAVHLQIQGAAEVSGDAMAGADGLWSAVRAQVREDGPPTPTGHLAYRGLAVQRDLPAPLRTADVTVWLGPRLHVVAYPVRRGEAVNVVAIVQGTSRGRADDWDQAAIAADLQEALGLQCAPLRDLVRAVPGWRLWALHDRPALRGADEMARGRIALLGDAAHPMRPYFAQGAGMAIEDAAQLARSLGAGDAADVDVPGALHAYAIDRWERCARVQARSRRNGRIFHATGPLRWARDVSLRLLGERLLDQPWLYRRSA